MTDFQLWVVFGILALFFLMFILPDLLDIGRLRQDNTRLRQALSMSRSQYDLAIEDLKGKQCETCRHWDQQSYLPGECGFCKSINDGIAIAFLRTGREGADLVTEPEFGCVLHEERTEETHHD